MTKASHTVLYERPIRFILFLSPLSAISHMLGSDTNAHHASRHTMTSPAFEMRYVCHELEKVEGGQVLKVFLTDEKTNACMNYRFYDNASVVRSFAEVTNVSDYFCHGTECGGTGAGGGVVLSAL